MSFVVPPLTESARCRLHLRLRDREGRIVARNIQYLSFFPHAARRPARNTGPIWVHDPFDMWDLEEKLVQEGYQVVGSPAGGEGARPALAVVSRLDDEVARFMEEGGSVLFLVRSPGDIQSDLVQRTGIRIRDRRVRIDERSKEKNPWEGDWVSNFNWIKHDLLFDGIPRTVDSPFSGELMDMQYYRVIPNQVLIGWSPERDFADIHAGMVVGWVHAPVTLMAQCKWGKGKLLLTTMKVESGYGDDPVATVLLNNLLGYVAGHRFKPQKDALAPRRAASREGNGKPPAVSSISPLPEALAAVDDDAADESPEATDLVSKE
ncbi:MAG: glycoside hydrolase family 2 [Armatimonadetes bacterium]|nr:glycoside hydrolase family 2 [Armatimonadota bacterium]